MRGEGSPPTAVRAVVFGALCQLDAELLNQLLVRRDCCTMSAIKILQARLGAAYTPHHVAAVWQDCLLSMLHSKHHASPPNAENFARLAVCK